MIRKKIVFEEFEVEKPLTVQDLSMLVADMPGDAQIKIVDDDGDERSITLIQKNSSGLRIIVPAY